MNRTGPIRGPRPAPHAPRRAASLAALLAAALAAGLAAPGLARAAEGGEAPAPRELTEVAVYGADGAQLLLDGRRAGALPLAGPLQVPTGDHELTLERGGRRITVRLGLHGGRPVEVRFTLVPPLAIVTPTDAALLLADCDGLPAAARAALGRAAVAGAAPERVIVLPEERLPGLLRGAPELGRCLDRPDCQERLAARAAARYLLRVRASAEAPRPAAGPGPWRLAATLDDVDAGAAAARAEEACARCDVAQAAARLAALVGRVIREGSLRPRGALEVTTTPAGARAELDGRALGVTPLRRAAFAGPHELALALPGFQPLRLPVEVEADRTARIQRALQPTAPLAPAAPPAAPRPSPALRAGKWIVGGIGLAEIALGGLLLGLDGYQRCDKADLGHCRYELDSGGAGVGLLVAGGVTLGAAGLLLYLERRAEAGAGRRAQR